MNPSIRPKHVSKTIEALAHYVTTDPDDEPVRFIQELATHWKTRGGTIAGKRRHSDRYLDDLLRRQGTPIRSLTPKLAGRTKVKPTEAESLVRLFLSHWDYVGGSKNVEFAEGSPPPYKPLTSDDQIEEVSRYVKDRISEAGQQPKRESESSSAPPSPSRGLKEILATEFKKSIAMFSVGSGQSVLVARPEMALIGFRDIINTLWEIDQSDDQERILVWTLDVGRQDFEDPESRIRFMNAEALRARFKALKRFKDRDTDARWNWLKSRAVILLHDTRGVRPDVARLPAFYPHHILLDAIPPRWLKSTEFSRLFGTTFERVTDSNYLIFLERTTVGSLNEIGKSEELTSPARFALRYFGLALLNINEKDQSELRGLELDAPGLSYVEALGTAFLAASERLGIRSALADLLIDGMNIDPAYVTEKLRHHGFLLQNIDEFVKF